MRHISHHGLLLIESYEGFSSKPYQLGDGVTTIGFGETQGVTMRTGPWSRAYAEQRLKHRVRHDYEPYVHRLGIPLTQNQFDALVSAVYNLGPGVLDRGRSLGDALRSGNKGSHAWVVRVQHALLLYSMPGTQFHQGLLRRRKEEAKLFGRAPVNRRKRRLRRLRAELARIHAHVKLIGHWTPKRRARSVEIERTINRLTHNAAKGK